MERFWCPAEIAAGADALTALNRWQGKHLFLLVQKGPGEAAVSCLQGRFRKTTVFSLGEIPSVGEISEGVSRLQEAAPDVAAAVGAGAVLDGAKLAVGLAGGLCPLVTVPLCPCAGREVTGTGEFFHGGRRRFLRGPELTPVLTVLAPELYGRASREAVAAGGFGLLSNAVETALCPHGGTLSRLLSREAFCMGWATLSAACAGRETARDRLQMASVMAGLAMEQTGLGLCHGLAGALGGLFARDPDRLKPVLLPAVLGWTEHRAGKTCRELSKSAGITPGLREGFIRLRRELGLPETLAQAGLNPGAVWGNAVTIAERTLADPGIRGSPVAADDYVIRRILEEVTGHL